MLKLLKNFAIQHFPEEEFLDITIEYNDGTKASYATKNTSMGIKLPNNFVYGMDLWIAKEEDEYIFFEICKMPIKDDEKEVQLQELKKIKKLNDYEKILAKTRKIYKNTLIPLEYEDMPHITLSDLSVAIDAFKERINQEIERHESEAKRMRKGYSFLRKLQAYNI